MGALGLRGGKKPEGGNWTQIGIDSRGEGGNFVPVNQVCAEQDEQGRGIA